MKCTCKITGHFFPRAQGQVFKLKPYKKCICITSNITFRLQALKCHLTDWLKSAHRLIYRLVFTLNVAKKCK